MLDHNSLLNKGTRSHQEIDEHLSEIEEARSSYSSLPERLDEMERVGKLNDTLIAGQELRIADLEPKVLNQGILLEDQKSKLSEYEKAITEVSTDVHEQNERLESLENELGNARGNHESIADVISDIEDSIDDLKTNPLSDLAISSVTMEADGLLKVLINGGYASINSALVQKEESFYSFMAEQDTRYYVFLKNDGTFMHLLDPDEPDNAMILGSIAIGATSDAIYIKDHRYFLTKTVSAGNFKDLQAIVEDAQSHIIELDEEVVSLTNKTKDLSKQVEDLGEIKTEVFNSRTDKDGFLFDKLPDRLNHMQSKLELAASRGTMENQSIFRIEYPPDIRVTDQKSFYCPKYSIGSDSVEVLLDGIRVTSGEDYIEYTDTEIRFFYDIPVDSRVTLLSRGSIINTSSTSEYEYDSKGRMKREIITGGINRIIEYEYDLEGNLLEELITESDGQVKTITYEREEGRIKRKSNNGAMYFYLQGSSTYDDRSVKHRLSTLEDMEEQDVYFEYDPENGLIIKETTYNNDLKPSVIKMIEYGYNPDGSVDTEIVEFNGSKISKKYLYDSDGNILGVQKRKVG
ncbi:hypothetical protein ACFVQB_16575 [Paenibacillus sp. NPDC057886]|uniref:RHS repeat domain-containing protein n=1 Tax=Paenibacillus sp. NPDC057886 TaxID=3346270 RepID=UPI0036A9A1D8